MYMHVIHWAHIQVHHEGFNLWRQMPILTCEMLMGTTLVVICARTVNHGFSAWFVTC